MRTPLEKWRSFEDYSGGEEVYTGEGKEVEVISFDFMFFQFLFSYKKNFFQKEDEFLS